MFTWVCNQRVCQKTTEAIEAADGLCQIKEGNHIYRTHSVPDTGTGGDALFRLSHLGLPTELEMSVKIDSRW